MDPNANLKEQLRLASRILSDEYDWSLDRYQLLDMGEALAQYVIDLDEWITKGGFLPDRWRKEQ